jgi:hypothetical protein
MLTDEQSKFITQIIFHVSRCPGFKQMRPGFKQRRELFPSTKRRQVFLYLIAKES